MARFPRSRDRFREFRAELREKGEDAAKRDKPPRERPGQAYFQRDTKNRSRSFWELLRRFYEALAGFHLMLAGVLVFVAISTAFHLALPAAPKIVIDYVLTAEPGPEGLPAWLGLPTDRVRLLWVVAIGIVVAELISLVIDVAARWRLTKLARLMSAAFRRRVFRHAVRLPLWRVQAIKSGGVASVLRGDANAVSELLMGLLYSPWRAVLRLIGTTVVLVYVDWRLVVGVVGVLPLVWVSHRTWIARIRPVYRGMRHTREEVDGQATEAFGGMRVVRAFSKEQTEARRFSHGIHLMMRQELMAWWWSRFVEIVWRVIVPAGSAAVLLYGGVQVLEGTLTIGDLILFTTYTLMLLGPIESLVGAATSIQSSLAGFDRVLDLLDEDAEFADQVERRSLDPARVEGRITFEGVSFAYPGSDDEVLREIDVDIAGGQTVALVGPSGAGKTTFSNLVARFYDPTAGRVLLDGVPLDEIDVYRYRELLGVVEQDVFLFDGTLAENIAYGRDHATREQIEAAARRAHAHDFITGFSEGYDTVIGERGVRLSGGQKQRIALARAILADPRILILDEATSNLDSESEARIQESLDELMRGRTSFVIAHRLSTVRGADRILVIEDGRVVEDGSHDELIARGGRYVSFLQHQLDAEERAKLIAVA